MIAQRKNGKAVKITGAQEIGQKEGGTLFLLLDQDGQGFRPETLQWRSRGHMEAFVKQAKIKFDFKKGVS